MRAIRNWKINIHNFFMKLKMAINSRFRDDLMNDRRNRQFLLGVKDNSDKAGL